MIIDDISSESINVKDKNMENDTNGGKED